MFAPLEGGLDRALREAVADEAEQRVTRLVEGLEGVSEVPLA